MALGRSKITWMHGHIDDAGAFLMERWGQFSEGRWHVSRASVVHFIEVDSWDCSPRRSGFAQ